MIDHGNHWTFHDSAGIGYATPPLVPKKGFRTGRSSSLLPKVLNRLSVMRVININKNSPGIRLFSICILLGPTSILEKLTGSCGSVRQCQLNQTGKNTSRGVG